MDNGKPLPDVSGTLTITTNSVSDIYDDLVDVIDVIVMEDRDVGDAVYIAPVIANETLILLTDEGRLIAYR